MVFTYKTMTAPLNSASAGIGLGTVIMMTDYDAGDNPPNSKQVMEAAKFTTSSIPSTSMSHGIENKGRENVLKRLYVRTGPLGSADDIRFFDLGNLYLATQGIPNSSSNQTIGELWISYRFRLLKPILTASQIPVPPIAGGNLIDFVINASSRMGNASMFGATTNFITSDEAAPTGILDGTVSGFIPGLHVGLNATASFFPSTANTIWFQNNSGATMSLVVIYSVTGSSTALTTGITWSILTVAGAGTGVTGDNLFSGNISSLGSGGTMATAFLVVALNVSANSTGSIFYNTTATFPGSPQSPVLLITRVG